MSNSICIIDGCGKPRYQQRKLCSTHAMRKHRYGDPSIGKSREGNTWTTSNGYGRLFVGHDHPLADGKGCAHSHRVALFERIGPGVHQCHWCGADLQWLRRGSSWAGVLVVDHLDDDKGNNAPGNLVPSCFSCNALRARWGTGWLTRRVTPPPDR